MQLKRIQELLAKYKTHLRSRKAKEHLYIWESQQIFQSNWDLEVLDFSNAYDRSLENSQTRRLWKRENYEPKRLMSLFIEMAEDMVRHAFQEYLMKRKKLRVG